MTSPNQKGRYGRYVTALLSLTDLLMVNLVFWVTVRLNPELHTGDLRLVWVLVNVAYLPVIYWFSHFNRLRALKMEHVVTSSIQSVGIHALFFISLVAFLRVDYFSDKVYLIFYGLLLVWLPVWWVVSRRLLKHFRRKGKNFVRVVIVGANNTGMRLYEELLSDAGFGYRVLGFFDTERPSNFGGRYLGDIADLDDYIRRNKVDEIFYTLSGENQEAMHQVMAAADDNVVQFYYVPQISSYLTRNFEMYNIGAMPVLNLRHNPMKSVINRISKRTFDIVFSSAFLIVSPIIFVPVAIAIKLSSPGPVFFKQERTGYKGRSFKCLKFRTMKVNDKADSVQATQHDPRKTKVGDFLRRTSIDELPQFVNVFKGEMSVVGPRPHMLKHTEQYSQVVDKYMVRHIVKPGITGWAQINGYRGITDEVWKMEKRVQHDVWYIEHWTFFLDLKIILKTVLNAFKGEENAF